MEIFRDLNDGSADRDRHPRPRRGSVGRPTYLHEGRQDRGRRSAERWRNRLELWRHAGRRTVRSVRDLVGVAVAGLTARWSRTLLIMLGPIIGVSAIVAAVGLTESAKGDLQETSPPSATT